MAIPAAYTRIPWFEKVTCRPTCPCALSARRHLSNLSNQENIPLIPALNHVPLGPVQVGALPSPRHTRTHAQRLLHLVLLPLLVPFPLYLSVGQHLVSGIRAQRSRTSRFSRTCLARQGSIRCATDKTPYYRPNIFSPQSQAYAILAILCVTRIAHLASVSLSHSALLARGERGYRPGCGDGAVFLL